MTEKLKAKFGDLIENGWASEANPTRTGYFVREFRRPHGRMNAGLTWEITDGKGKFWELSPTGDHKITVRAAPIPPIAVPVSEEMVEAMRHTISISSLPKGEFGAKVVVEMGEETNLYDLLSRAWDTSKNTPKRPALAALAVPDKGVQGDQGTET